MDSDLDPTIVGEEALADIKGLWRTVWRDLIGERWDDGFQAALDEEVRDSIYWVVRSKAGAIVASARLSYHRDVREVSHSAHFPELRAMGLSGRLGWISRLVILEPYRGWGLSRQFDVLREARARKDGCTHLFAFARGRRLVSLYRRGWERIELGQFEPEHHLAGMGQQAIIKRLDQEGP
jgi:hypothetical protein